MPHTKTPNPKIIRHFSQRKEAPHITIKAINKGTNKEAIKAIKLGKTGFPFKINFLKKETLKSRVKKNKLPNTNTIQRIVF